MRFLRGLLLIVVLACVAWVAFVVTHYMGVPHGNTSQDRFDTLIVLGTTPKPDGTPSPDLRERVEEGVRQYRAGVAPHLIMTGAAAHSQWVEAQVMKDLAVREGVPADAVIVEDKAQNTVQNIFYSHAIMEAHGWHSAQVISLPYHLPRTGMILQHYTGADGFAWKTEGAHWPPEYTWWDRTVRDWREALYCAGLRIHGFKHSAFLPNS